MAVRLYSLISISALEHLRSTGKVVRSLTTTSVYPLRHITAVQRMCLGLRKPLAIPGSWSRLPACPCSSHTQGAPISTVEYAEIKELPRFPEKLLIDVREPEELNETGQILTSINIPLDSVGKVLGPAANSQDFQMKYGRSKPTNDCEVIFTCKMGKRALAAAQIAQSLGYRNVKTYEGSWIDWAELLGVRNLALLAGSFSRCVSIVPRKPLMPTSTTWSFVRDCQCNSHDQGPTIPTVMYAEIKELPKHLEKLLVDVREPDELKKSGEIPSSINIALGCLDAVLGPNTKSEDFKVEFGREKPTNDSEIIFSCNSGKRALKAAQIAQSLGYDNVKVYAGSWKDWAAHEGLPK